MSWACIELDCPEAGDKDTAAEKHTKATDHPTTTATTPEAAASIAARARAGRREG